MEGREDQVTRQRGADGNLGGLEVTDFPDHDDVGVLSQCTPESARESEADFRAGLDLIGAGHFILDRIFYRDDAQLGRVDGLKEGIERGGLT